MKRIFSLLLVLVLLLSGCSLPKVLPVDETEMCRYVQETYGDATLLSSEYLSEVHRFKFRDTALGFDYYVSSEVRSMGVAGLEGKQEVKISDFQTKYNAALWMFVDFGQLSDGVGVEIVEHDDLVLGYITIMSKQDEVVGKNLLTSIGTQLDALDTRRFLGDYILVMRDTHGIWLGRYDFSQSKYVAEIAAHSDTYMGYAKEMFRNDALTYEKVEVFTLDEVPGLSNEILTGVMSEDRNAINCYYFSYKNKSYFIAECVVMHNGTNYYYVYNVTDNCSMTGKFK